MTDSAIALSIFGSDKAVLATDVAAGVHTLKVTTANPTDGIVVPGFGATRYAIGTVKTGGVHTICATTSAATDGIALNSFGTGKIVLGTVQSGGVHVMAVTTSAANSSIAISSFGSGITLLGTVLSGGIHTLAANSAADNGFAISTFGSDKSVIAAALSGGVYSLTLSGLTVPYVGPLDGYTSGLCSAYCVSHRLLTSYTGPLIKLLRDSDNAELDFGYTSAGLLDTTAIASWGGAANLFYSRIYDQFAGLNLLQSTIANMPAYLAAGFQGKPTMSFDGVNDRMRCASGVSLGAWSIFAAGKWNKNADAALYEHSDNTNGNDGCLANFGVAFDCLYANRVAVSKSSRADAVGRMADNTARITCHRSNGTNATHLLRSNGVDRTIGNGSLPGNSGTSVASTSFNLHARADGSIPMPGQTSCVIPYSSYLNATDMAAVEAIINNLYAVF